MFGSIRFYSVVSFGESYLSAFSTLRYVAKAKLSMHRFQHWRRDCSGNSCIDSYIHRIRLHLEKLYQLKYFFYDLKKNKTKQTNKKKKKKTKKKLAERNEGSGNEIAPDLLLSQISVRGFFLSFWFAFQGSLGRELFCLQRVEIVYLWRILRVRFQRQG